MAGPVSESTFFESYNFDELPRILRPFASPHIKRRESSKEVETTLPLSSLHHALIPQCYKALPPVIHYGYLINHSNFGGIVQDLGLLKTEPIYSSWARTSDGSCYGKVESTYVDYAKTVDAIAKHCREQLGIKSLKLKSAGFMRPDGCQGLAIINNYNIKFKQGITPEEVESQMPDREEVELLEKLLELDGPPMWFVDFCNPFWYEKEPVRQKRRGA